MKNKINYQNIIIFLSMHPEGGGKYQYSISIVNSMGTFCSDNVRITAVFYDNSWKNYIPDNIKKIKADRPSTIVKIIRKIILLLPLGLAIWRVVGKYIHPVHQCLSCLKPDLVCYPGNDSYAYEINLSSCIPIFDLMHRYERDFPEVADKKIFKSREYHYNKICKYAKIILVDSEVGKQQVLECYEVERKKVFVLPYIAPPYIYNINKEINVIQKYNLPDKYIFYPAQFWQHKNHIGLIKAISILKAKNVIINAIFVGSSKNADENIDQTIKELDLKQQILIMDYVNNQELVSLYINAIALVMPTFFGPTNIPPLEAFALGCPVVTSGIYGIPEQVGNAALLVDPHNTNDIAEKIEMIWLDKALRNNLIEKGYKVNNIYTLNTFTRKLFNILISSSK